MRTLATAILLSVFVSPAASASSRTISETFSLDGAETVRFELPVGEVRVETVPGREVTVDLELRCRWQGGDCSKAVEAVRLERRASKRWLLLRVDDRPSWGKLKVEIEGRVLVPRDAAVEIEMGVGKLEVRGVSRDLQIDLGVGEVTVRAARKDFGPISLDVGVGEAELLGPGERVGGRRSLLVGSEIYSDLGEGASRLEVEVGVGEASVWLE